VPTLQFNIRFKTSYGQSLWIVGNLPELGGGDPQKALPMEYLNEDFWQLTMEVAVKKETLSLSYYYLLQTEEGVKILEGEKDRTVRISKNEKTAFVDTWNHAGSFENTFYTAPFEQLILPVGKKRKSKKVNFYTHTFRVKCPLLLHDEHVCLVGNDSVIGNWLTDQPVLLEQKDNWWEIKLDLRNAIFPLTYKYGIWNSSTHKFIRFEEGDNRLVTTFENFTNTILQDGFVRLPIKKWKGAGVAIPVFSLRSKNSFGVGEFQDIPKLIDWAKQTGLKLIQLLPINDTTATHTWLDSYPYAAISAFALHPIYLNIAAVAGTKQAGKLRLLRKVQEQLNNKPSVDYEAVMRVKLTTLRELYEELGEDCFASAAYKNFEKENKYWLKPYAAFCYLRDNFGTIQFSEWSHHAVYNESEIEALIKDRKCSHAIGFYKFIQFHLHSQLSEAVAYAHDQGVVLKGDIPIGIYRHGVDAWVEPALYNMEWQAGAPPDDFTAIGQNWGFPTYNWKQMQEDGFFWWRKRFEQMGHYFDAFRIDHILGFFRIWSIPTHAVQGLMGRFVPAIPIHINEFAQRGISLNYKRYCQPFINEEILYEIFGDLQFQVREQFLCKEGDGQWSLSPQYDTQKKIEHFFESLPPQESTDKIKLGLMELAANIILLEEPDSEGHQFHFRISMDKTLSYRYLDPFTQGVLRDLYNDYFYRRQDAHWKQEALQKLPFLKAATNMLVCGEDLGMVPHCVPDVMQQTGILSLEIQRMPKDSAKEFFHPADAPYLSVVTPSTHDMSTIRGWWEENRQRTQLFYNQEMKQWGDAPYFCEAWINRAIILQHLHSPAMWSIFQLQDLLGSSEKLRRADPREERINDPANPRHYWQYRMHIYLEDLVEEKEFNLSLHQAIQEAGR
jgi:4-alpha-glucanotransferase